LVHENNFKDLGVLINDRLTFIDHIHDKMNKARAVHGFKRYFNISSSILSCKGMVR